MSHPLPLDSFEFYSASRRVALDRREFLRAAGLLGAAAPLYGFQPMHAAALPRGSKVVVVTFGGGARDEETFAPDGQENIPNLIHTLLPQATFYSRVVNQGILGHYVATASLATGAYETFNNFADTPPVNPTVFEYYRKARHRPATDAWVVAPSNGFNRIGESNARGFGPGLGAGVILPKHLLAAAMPQHGSNAFTHLLRDNFEDPYYTPDLAGGQFELSQLDSILKLSVAEFTQHALSLSSADELSVFVAHQLMRRLAPSLLWITLHDMDIAHSGAFSLYVEGIRRSDRLCAEIWRIIQSEPEYAGKTTLFILPDFGRDSDFDSGGNGFQHHRTGDALSRTTWMMALGPGIRQGAFIDRPVQSIDLVPTLGARMGFPTPGSRGRVLSEVLG